MDLCGASRGGFGWRERVCAYLAPEVLVGRHPSPRLARGRGAERSLKPRAEKDALDAPSGRSPHGTAGWIFNSVCPEGDASPLTPAVRSTIASLSSPLEFTRSFNSGEPIFSGLERVDAPTSARVTSSSGLHLPLLFFARGDPPFVRVEVRPRDESSQPTAAAGRRTSASTRRIPAQLSSTPPVLAPGNGRATPRCRCSFNPNLFFFGGDDATFSDLGLRVGY